MIQKMKAKVKGFKGYRVQELKKQRTFLTKLVPKAGLPKSYSDLLKPEWKGQLGMEARAYEWFATIVGRKRARRLCAL